MAKSKKKPEKLVVSQDLITSLILLVKKAGKRRLYLIGSLLILFSTAALWSVLGARLQQNNADQLSLPYLFSSRSDLQNANFSGAHTFLIKWPLLLIVKLLGYSDAAFIGVTVAAVLITLALLVWILYRIERRPLLLGTLCLALASVLLLVPAQPYAGGLLPVNMAMLATRNLEYVVYIAAIAFFVRSGGWRNWRFWLSVVLLASLIASDKLFLSISLFSGLLALIIYSLKRCWDYVNMSSSFLVAAIAAAVIGAALIGLVNVSGLTHISSTNTPYTFVNSGKDIILGSLYALLGLATNFGANPAYDATIVRHIPHNLFSGLLSWRGPVYLLNFGILLAGIWAAYKLVKSSLASKRKRLLIDRYTGMGLILVWTTAAALLTFIFSSHYYAVDSRYLTISLFSLFICLALLARNRNWSDKKIYASGAVITAGIVLGTLASIQTYHKQTLALSDMNRRNNLIAQALKGHPVDTLLGDYWRVLPIKQHSANNLAVTPLSGCLSNREVLSSKNWQPNLEHKRFAYLLSLDKGLTDYPACNLPEVLDKYGRPNSSVLIAGNFSHPKELLLLYDHGVNKSKTAITKTPGTILPVNLPDLTNVTCPVPTEVNIVAHQDDDLLFMNPDIMHSIQAGHCIRTIYVTAGDAGQGQYYWLSRELGSQAAYAKMLNQPDNWINRIVKIKDNEFITISSLKGNSRVSLIYVHLPDGGLFGQGFGQYNSQGLEKLESGQINSIQSVDGQSKYSESDLIDLISTLLHVYQPAEIRTQSNYESPSIKDHSDHKAVGRLVKKAYALYETQQFEGRVSIPLHYYIGYPIHVMPENISDGELAAKSDIFFQYAKFDNAVCLNLDQCGSSVFGLYLGRQYQNNF